MKKILSLVVAALVFAAGCRKAPDADSKILARVSNKTITLGDFKSRIAKLPPYYRDMINRNKKRYLDETVVETMFYEEAVRKGLNRDKEVREIINEAKKKILIAKLIKNEVEDKIRVGTPEMLAFYTEHKEDFKTPELWRASHILVSSESEARDILNELSGGASFEELAKAHSIDATATRGGDVGYFRMGQLVPEFEKACSELKVGETSGIVRTKFGFHIIKLTDKKEPAPEAYEKVKGAIGDELRKKKRSELFDKLVARLKEKYQVKIEEDVFESLEKVEGTKEAKRE